MYEYKIKTELMRKVTIKVTPQNVFVPFSRRFTIDYICSILCSDNAVLQVILSILSKYLVRGWVNIMFLLTFFCCHIDSWKMCQRVVKNIIFFA